MTGLTKSALSNVLDEKVKESAFNYLLEGKSKLKKGKQIEYEELKMAHYLSFQNCDTSVSNKTNCLKLRLDMVPLATNFPNKFGSKMCQIGCEDVEEDIFHIF